MLQKQQNSTRPLAIPETKNSENTRAAQHPPPSEQHAAVSLKCPRSGHLPGALAHLPPLAPQAPHALLPPLGTHTTHHIKVKGDSVSLIDEVGQAALALELHTSAHQAHGVSREELLVLDGGLQAIDSGVGGNIHSKSVRMGFYKKLHVVLIPDALTLFKSLQNH